MLNPEMFVERIVNITLPPIITQDPVTLKEIAIPGLVRISSPGDGSCLFHSILRAFNRQYNESTYTQRKILVRRVRDSLSEALTQINPLTGKQYYEEMAGGHIASLGATLPDYSLGSLQRVLNSDSSVGSEFMQSLSHFFNIDIYVIDMERKDLYMFGVDDSDFHKDRRSIVLAYTQMDEDGHYDVIGLNISDIVYTLFEPRNFLIQALNARAATIKHRS